MDLGLSANSTMADNDALRPIYGELRRLAAQKMAHEAPGHTLQPTALVHEAWLRLGADAQPIWQNRAHFFGAAAEAMRRILVERERRKHREKRGRYCHRSADYFDSGRYNNHRRNGALCGNYRQYHAHTIR
jgi:RNA polymerase sigma factor (TIGR02999 family)